MSRATVSLGVLLIVSMVAIIFLVPLHLFLQRISTAEMASSWNPCERTQADYHAGGLTFSLVAAFRMSENS